MLPLLLLLAQFSSLPPGEPGLTRVVVQVADRAWGVKFAPEGFEFGPPERTADGRRAWAAGDGPRGMTASLLLEPAGSAGSAVECRAQADEGDGRSAERNYRYEQGRRGALEWTAYVVPEFHGVPVNQRHLHAFLYRDGYCIELELAMPHYKERLQARIDEALDALQIVDAP